MEGNTGHKVFETDFGKFFKGFILLRIYFCYFSRSYCNKYLFWTTSSTKLAYVWC